ncbi:MAG TPA: DUF4926 domain-containing protein, partial [Thermomicrobiales bacterium]|nr:DUF4926 domain-containing protein [Thermomicrobiales bacterium]
MDELDLVVLTRDIPDEHLRQGDVGTVVHRYADGRAFEVEFATAAGTTIAVLTLGPGDIRPLGGRDLLHIREYGR